MTTNGNTTSSHADASNNGAIGAVALVVVLAIAVVVVTWPTLLALALAMVAWRQLALIGSSTATSGRWAWAMVGAGVWIAVWGQVAWVHALTPNNPVRVTSVASGANPTNAPGTKDLTSPTSERLGVSAPAMETTTTERPSATTTSEPPTTTAASPPPTTAITITPPPSVTTAPPNTTITRPAPTTTRAPAPPPAPPTTRAPPPAPTSGCHSSYSPCVPIGSDADCAGGSGNGPIYVHTKVRVIGPDVYGLDADHDGYGCDNLG